VVGGTGFVGRYLVDALHAAAHDVTLLVRPGSRGKIESTSECRIVGGDIASTAAVTRSLEGSDAVIYNIGILREFAGEGITFEALQFDGCVRVVDAAREAGVSRMLLMSANGVNASGTAYQRTKYRAEQYAAESGLDVTVLRPSVIFGDPRGAMEFATQLHRDMVRPPLPAVAFFTGWKPAHGKILMSPVHVEDVALAFVNALDSRTTIGKTFILGGPEVLSWSEIINCIAQSVGKRKYLLPVPTALMKVAAGALDWLPFFPVTHDQLCMLEAGNVASPADLQALIGREPRAFSVGNLTYLATD
jgi:NADH dehydrogenase